MYIRLDERDLQIVHEIADKYDVDSDKLYEMYIDIMRNNFYQDLADIARENEEELK